jgi:hypothetical protein
MMFKSLLDGPSRLSTTSGPRYEIIRLLSNRFEPEFRKIHISYRSISTKRRFLLPWKEDVVIDLWDITATLTTREGVTYSLSQIVNLDFDRSVELMALEVARLAMIAKCEYGKNRQAV